MSLEQNKKMNPFHVFTLISKLIDSVPLVSLIACPRSVITVDFPYLPLWQFRFFLLTFGNQTIWRPTRTQHERIWYIKSVLNTIWKRFGPFEHKTLVFQLFAAWVCVCVCVCNIPTVTFGMIYIFSVQMRNGTKTLERSPTVRSIMVFGVILYRTIYLIARK